MKASFVTQEQIAEMIKAADTTMQALSRAPECLPIEDLKSKHALEDLAASIDDVRKNGEHPIIFIHADDYQAFCLLTNFSRGYNFSTCTVQKAIDAGFVGVFHETSVYTNRFIKNARERGLRIPSESILAIMPGVKHEKAISEETGASTVP